MIKTLRSLSLGVLKRSRRGLLSFNYFSVLFFTAWRLSRVSVDGASGKRPQFFFSNWKCGATNVKIVVKS